MKNLIKAQGLRAQMVALGSMPNLSPAMQQWLQAGVNLIDHVFEDKKEAYENEVDLRYKLERILDKAESLMAKIVDLAALEKAHMDQEPEEPEERKEPEEIYVEFK